MQAQRILAVASANDSLAAPHGTPRSNSSTKKIITSADEATFDNHSVSMPWFKPTWFLCVSRGRSRTQ
jgi:hypothetical protein